MPCLLSIWTKLRVIYSLNLTLIACLRLFSDNKNFLPITTANLTNYRSQRLRAELFPDTNDDGYQQQYSSPITPTTPLLNLQTVGEPSDQITNVLPQFQDDDKLALQAVPEFAKLLNDNSLDILAPVATCIHQFSKKESSMHAILSCPQLLTNLIKTLSTSSDIEVGILAF